MNQVNQTGLPKDPYKGLARFDVTDYPLFGGREKDVEKCRLFLIQPYTKVLQVHGAVGCGKSSFLRAGLGFKMRDQYQFEFVDSGPNAYFSFVSSVLAYLNKDQHYKIVTSPESYQTETKRYKDELPDKIKKQIPDSINSSWILNRWYDSPRNVVEVIDKLDKGLLTDVVFVVDQLEDIYVSSMSDDDEKWNRKFFEFLAEFSNCRTIAKIKLLLVLRTEHFGRFSMDFRREDPDLFAIGDYYLGDLSEEEISSAMLLPTLDEDILGLGKPVDKYRFKFADGLISEITRSVRRAPMNATILPVVQVICKQLYDKLASEEPSIRIISYADFENLGDVENQLLSYIESSIAKVLKGRFSRVQESIQTSRWEEILSNLTTSNSFGVSRAPIALEEFERRAHELKVETNPREMIKHLSEDPVRIVEHTKTFDSKNRREVNCVTLSHDSLALALSRWKSIYEGKLTASELAGPLGSSSKSPAELTANDLFPLSDSELCLYSVPTVHLLSIDSMIWDHKVLSFAEHNGFFSRLGIQIDFKEFNERYHDLPYDHYAKILEKGQDERLSILSLPRELVDCNLRVNSLGFAISNVFEGHAIMAFPKADELSNYRERDERISFLSSYLHGKKLFYEDKELKKFINAVKEVASMLDCGFEYSIEDYSGKTMEMIAVFEKNKDSAAIGSAPFKALCARVGASPIFRSSDLVDLLNDLYKNEKIAREKWRCLVSKSIIHNVWNINIPRSQWRSKQDLIMRLYSVCLFTNEYIIENKNEITEYIYHELGNSNKQMPYSLDRKSLEYTFWNSYRFIRPDIYYDTYCHPESAYYYPFDYENEEINAEYLLLKRRYEQLVEELKPRMKQAPKKVLKLIISARDHSRILNYYDAVKMLEVAKAQFVSEKACFKKEG